MTSETRTMVELADILGIEFGCPKCRAKVFYSLQEQPSRIVDKCPNCFEPFYTPLPPAPQREPPLYEQVGNWINGLCNLRVHKDLRAKLCFHVNTSTE
jgi:hypothetical protein